MSTQNTLEDNKVSTKLKLTSLWVSFMFLYSYVDYFHLYMPGKLDDIRKGIIFEFEISQGFILTALGLATIPILMICVTVLLSAKYSRLVNITVAVILIPYMLFNLVGEAWPHMYFAAAVEVTLLSLIIGFSWKWPKV